MGYNCWGSITGSYSTGKVNGDDNVGGLVGRDDGSITTSFWDIETSGQSTSSGGTGKTTAEMQMASTFIGWGCDPVWTIDERNDYPRLWWENKPGELLDTQSNFIIGAGTEDDPYLIYTHDQLNMIGLFQCDWDKHFKLMADIDLAGYTGTDFNIIGTRWDNVFTGVFDGNGHTISNFRYISTDTDNIGLFGYVGDPNSEIKDLGLIDANVDAGTGEGIGSLVGCLEDGTITGCYVQGGSVTGQYRVGGLVGALNYGTITDCSATGDVSGDWYVGGLVGYNYSGTIADCSATGSVLGDRYVGSLVGFNDNTIINCSATGIVSGDRYVGGLVGANEDIITNCYATGSVSGMTAIGGLVGYNRDTITNCYAKGDSVTGYSYVGGLVGYNRETITNSYAMGIVTGDRYVGGFVGDNLVGRITDSFWDIEASGQTLGVGLGSDDGISGKNMAEMQSLSTFIDAGWDFVDETENGTEDIWRILEGQDYPRLWWELLDDLSPVIDIVISNPIPDERFVRGEDVRFSVIESSQLDLEGFQLEWTSNIDGDLGTGLELTLDNLSTGSHVIQVCGYGVCASISVRIYEDLWELYQSPPAEGEIARILNDFSFNLIDGDESDEKWDAYDPVFDQNSTDPSFLVAISKIDILRHQSFSTPVPFANGQTLYDHFKTYVKTINLKLDCSYNSAGGDRVNLNRNFSVWDGRMSGTTSNPDACKIPFANHSLYNYTSPIYLLLHEVRHCEPTDPGHQMCDGRPKDEMLEDGGGYAQAALYLMWVYKYGLYDPPFIRSEARSTAAMFLNGFLCTTPTHSDPNVQAIIDELLN